MAYTVIPFLLLIDIHLIHPVMAICTTRQAKSLHAWGLHCYRHRCITTLPLYDTTSAKTRVLGCPINAMDSFHIHLPQHILVGVHDRPSYVRFGFFSALAVLVYVFYSVHASFDAEEDGTLSQKNIELVKESIEVQDHTLKV
ncbi:hypothetical protein HAX54_015951 [Datura stramonium]|uniref:Uncharacterized protein n=1 Tax=Datura stramonium TaxID=4076 RepID=A0ABS8UJM5_DATST|nr:hypothetical protein [Datura stramonium]